MENTHFFNALYQCSHAFENESILHFFFNLLSSPLCIKYGIDGPVTLSRFIPWQPINNLKVQNYHYSSDQSKIFYRRFLLFLYNTTTISVLQCTMFVRYQDELWRFMYEFGRLNNDYVEIFLLASQMEVDFIRFCKEW